MVLWNWNLIINIYADIIILRYGAIYCSLQAKFVLKSTAQGAKGAKAGASSVMQNEDQQRGFLAAGCEA